MFDYIDVLRGLDMEPISQRAAAFVRLAESWFDAIEAGIADRRIPSLDEPVCSQAKADKWVLKLEQYFKDQILDHYGRTINSYFSNKGIDMPPGFDRIVGTPAALGFWQDWQRLRKRYPKEEI